MNRTHLLSLTHQPFDRPRWRITSALTKFLARRSLVKLAFIALVSFFFSGLAYAQMDLEIRGKGVAIRNAGTTGPFHMYPLGTRIDWETGRYRLPGEYHFFDGNRPSRISGKNYATTAIAGDYHLKNDYGNKPDSRNDYSLDSFKSSSSGEVVIAVSRSGLNAAGWSRISGAFNTSVQNYYLFRYNYTSPGQWVNIPKTDSDHPTLIFTDGKISWENPLPLSTLAEGVKISENRTGRGYIIDPSMIIMPNGDYIASARGSTLARVNGRTVFVRLWKSTDKGRSWTRLHDNNTEIKHPSLWEHRGNLYLTGDLSGGGAGIQRSTDGGKTWSGVSRFSFFVRTAPSHVITAKGRFWIATEGDGGANVFSAATSSDLMNPRSWTLARRTGDGIGNEADLVATRNGGYPVIMGKHSKYARVLNAGEANSNGSRDRISLPGNNAKYSVVYDAVSDRYWALTSHSTVTNNVRTGITLFSSSDLTTWRVEKEVMKGLSTRFHGFNYPHMVVDGNDMVFVSRTAWEDSRGLTQRWHDANMFTFHRIRNFRNGTGTPPPPTGEYKRIKVRSSGHCLNVAKNSKEAGGTIIQWNCGDYDNEAFEVIDAGGGYVKFKAKSSGLCLNVYGNSSENGADIIQWDCGSRTANTNEHFKMESKGGGWFSLVARHSGKCVDIFRNSSEPDANVQQWSCNNNANQEFRFE